MDVINENTFNPTNIFDFKFCAVTPNAENFCFSFNLKIKRKTKVNKKNTKYSE